MAKYAPFGQAIFAETVFGIPPSETFLVTAPSITPVGYDGLWITWFPLTSPHVTEQVLVRSSWGIPTDTTSGGTVLLNEYQNQSGLTSPQTVTGFSASYMDTNLRSGHFYYYAIFAMDQVLGEFVFTGGAQGLVLTDWDFEQRFLSWTPDFYSTADANSLDQAPYANSDLLAGPLVRFMGLLGYEMDWMRSEIESLFMVNNADLVSGALLPVLGANYGMPYEQGLGMTRSRVLVKNAVQLYKHRGTLPGIEMTASAFSGYPVVVSIGTNQMIQLDSAAFDRSPGHWITADTHSLISVAPAGALATEHATYLPISGFATASSVAAQAGAHGYLPPNNVNVGVVSSSGAPLWITNYTTNQATVLSIPIPQSATPQIYSYVFSFYVMPQQQTTPALSSFVAQIDWYAANGGHLSSSTGTAVVEVADTWVRVIVAASTPLPAGSAASLGLTIKSSADLVGTNHLIDAMKLELNTVPTSWDPPRDIKINLQPARRNLVVNPQARAPAPNFGWSTTSAATLSKNQPATPFFPVGVISGFNLNIGTTVFHVAPAGYGDEPFGGGKETGTSVGAITQSMFTTTVARSGISYTFSAYVFKTTPGPGRIIAELQFLDGGGSPVGGMVGNPGSPPFVLPGPIDFGWQRVYVSGQAPTGSMQVTGTLEFVNAAGGDAFVVCGPMMEEAGTIGSYFDANFGPSSDYVFEGTPNESISDYYPNFIDTLGRLITVMPEYIPMGSTFSLVTGIPPVSVGPAPFLTGVTPAADSLFTTVTILGQNLTNAGGPARVFFSGLPGSTFLLPSSVTATGVEVVVESLPPGVYSVTLYMNDGSITNQLVGVFTVTV